MLWEMYLRKYFTNPTKKSSLCLHLNVTEQSENMIKYGCMIATVIYRGFQRQQGWCVLIYNHGHSPAGLGNNRKNQS